jgi:hypothetical protein
MGVLTGMTGEKDLLHSLPNGQMACGIDFWLRRLALCAGSDWRALGYHVMLFLLILYYSPSVFLLSLRVEYSCPLSDLSIPSYHLLSLNFIFKHPDTQTRYASPTAIRTMIKLILTMWIFLPSGQCLCLWMYDVLGFHIGQVYLFSLHLGSTT